VVVIVGAAGKFTAMLRGAVDDCAGLLWSVTCTTKLTVPLGPAGVPVMAPVLGLRLSPAGRLPELTEYARGA
jgi:hypothetical protein